MACEHTHNELAPMAAGLSGPLKSPKPSFLSEKGQSYLQRAIICAQHRKQKADVVTFISTGASSGTGLQKSGPEAGFAQLHVFIQHMRTRTALPPPAQVLLVWRGSLPSLAVTQK